MAIPEIVDISDVLTELGIASSVSDADRALLFAQKQRAENHIRKYLGHNITQPTTAYVHFLPNHQVFYADLEQPEMVDYVGNKAVFRVATVDGNRLQLPQTFVRSITEVREDYTAYGGDGASAFNSDTLLVEGTDYYANWDESGLCKDGILIRIGPAWSTVPRTVRVIYTAGFTADELDDSYSDIKSAVIDETIARFKRSKARAGANTDGAGTLKSEQLGDYSATYDTTGITRSGLTTDVAMALEQYLNFEF